MSTVEEAAQGQSAPHAAGGTGVASGGGITASPPAAAAAPRPSIKGDGGGRYGEYQRRRRDAALEAQRGARGARLQLARVLAAERLQTQQQQQQQQENNAAGMALDNEQATSSSSTAALLNGGDDGASFSLAAEGGAGGGTLTGAQLREHYARQLMQPEWLTDVPPDLARAWLVLPRPEGRRCLAVAGHGSTVLRSRTGALLGRVQSALPGGSRASCGGGGGGEFTIVDGVLVEGIELGPGIAATAAAAAAAAAAGMPGAPCSSSGNSGTSSGTTSVLYVADVVAWRGVALADCSAECRAFWLAGNLPQLCGGGGGGGDAEAGGGGGGGHSQLELRLLPALPADAKCLEAAARGGAGLLAAAAGAAPGGFVQDGVLLLHREGRYTPGTTPLALLWKDAGCSRYLLDTDADANVPDRQAVVLRCRADLTVATDDDPPVPLGALPAEWAARIGPKLLRAGRLLRFSLGARGVLFGPDDGRPYGADLRYEGPANARRGRADAFSKVLFQALARAGAAPSLEALKDAGDAGAGAMDADEAAAAGVAELAMQSL